VTQLNKYNIKPKIVARAEHNISQKDISPHALKILSRLYDEGFQAYLVGGCVRDLLLGIKPKDFDIATDFVLLMCFLVVKFLKLRRLGRARRMKTMIDPILNMA
jgi:Poly A polymerase head domain